MKKIFSDVLQGLPVVGTLVTSHKDPKGGKGKIKLGTSEWTRLIIGVVIAALATAGVLNIKDLLAVLEALT